MSSLYFYFLKTIFSAQNRQRLLIISILSLILSSMALMVIQSVMGGLQYGLVSRSKSILGDYVVELKSDENKNDLFEIKKYAKVSREFELELLLKNGSFVAPAVVKGLSKDSYLPDFLKDKDLRGIVLGGDLAYKVKSYHGDQIRLIAPGHVDLFFEEIPRSVSDEVSDFATTELIEVDGVTAWTRIELLQNLTRSPTVNRWRLFDITNIDKIKSVLKDKDNYRLLSWEERNQSLVWALSLESKVMLFLFISMCFLVAMTITTGFIVFFNKIKIDLTSLWILGTPKVALRKLGFRFSRWLSFSACLIGVGIGTLILYILDRYPINFMPDIFLQQSLPVRFEVKFFLIAFFVPFGVSYLLTWYSQKTFLKSEESYLEILKRSY